MTVHFNFGNVINSYVNVIFPNSDPIDKTHDSLDPYNDDDHPHDIPLRHKIVYSTFSILIILTLVFLCIITVNIKSVFMTNKSLDYAIDDIVAPNTNGLVYFINEVNKKNEEIVSEPGSKDDPSASSVKDISISLSHNDQINKINELKTRTDIALWIQFGLIPNLYLGLNTFNKSVANAVLISFKGKDKEYRRDIPGDILSASKVLLHSDPSRNNLMKSESGTYIYYKYPYDDKTASNYQYIYGEDIDEIMSKLMQGTGYLKEFPYFPLNSIISDEKIYEISLDFLTYNVISDVISSVNIKFNFSNSETTVNGSNESDSKINNKITVSSYRINTTLFPLVIDGGLMLVLMAFTIYTIILYKLYPKSFFLFDYIFDSIFKISVLLSLVFFNAIVFFANYSVPRVGSTNCDTGFCVSKIVFGYDDNPLDADKLYDITFDYLKVRIRVCVIVFGILCFFALVSVVTSLIATWLVVNKNRHLSIVYKKYYYHLKIPLISLIAGTGISILLIAVFNSSVAHMFKSSVQSIFRNFLALFNLILGVSSDATLKYIDNNSIIYSFVFILLLFISFYLAVILITSLLLMFDDNDKELNFYKRPVSWKFDNYRLLHFMYKTATRYNKIKRFIKSKILRMSVVSDDCAKERLNAQANQIQEYEYEPPETKRKFKFCLTTFFRVITYLAMLGCIIAFIFIEFNCLKVSRVIHKTVNELVYKNNQKWHFDTKFYNTSYTEMLKDPNLKPKNHKLNVKIESSLPNVKIKTYDDLYNWLNGGAIKELFKWVKTNDSEKLPKNETEVMAINSRYYLYPSNKALLLGLNFYRTPPNGLINNMKKIIGHDKYYYFITYDKDKCHISTLFETIPHTVKDVGIDFIIVDSESKNKIYNGFLNFFIEKSGLMDYDLRIYNVFSFFLPSENRNLFLFIVLGSTISLFIFLLSIMIKDIVNFRKGFKMYYPRFNFLYMISMYFFNDIKRVFDLIVIPVVMSLVVMYTAIIIYHRIMRGHFNEMGDIYYRYYYQLLSRRIFYMHSSLAILILIIILFGFILKNSTVRHYLHVVISVLYQMRYMYLNIIFYFMVMVFTFLFFFYFISRDYFKGNFYYIK
uniref:Uncharacterized protein n=1 Tax=Theileria annulata TaxID=5874 RepID=A0A3B0MX27_THEAN